MIGRLSLLFTAGLGTLVLLAPHASALGIYQELPNRANMAEPYEGVLVQVQDEDRDFRGVCDISLIWARDGSTIEVMDAIESDCSYENYTSESFHFDFQVTKDIAEYGKEYEFIVQATMEGSSGNKYTKTSDYAVKVNPKLVAAFETQKEGLVVSVDASKSKTEGNENINFKWNWGDESDSIETDSPLMEHQYSEEGEYVIELTTSDTFGQQEKTKRSVVVSSEGAMGGSSIPLGSWIAISAGLMSAVLWNLRYTQRE